jgi:hypothetical protein
MDDESPLFEDVKAMDKVGKALTPLTGKRRDVDAAERGTRYRPDGTVEEYERIEFR